MKVEAGIIEGITDEEYFSIDAVNASLLKDYDESINHGVWRSEQPAKESSALNIGTLTHLLCLEGERAFQDAIDQRYLIGGPINERTGTYYGKDTKAFREWVDENAHGRKVITEDDYNNIVAMATAIKNHGPSYETLIRCPKREAVIIWTDPDTGITCKAKMDMYGGPILCDLKSSARMDNKYQIMRDIRKWKYDIQFGFYFDGALAAGLPVKEFRAIFVGSQDEHDVACFRASKKILDKGRSRYKEALKRLLDARNGVRRGRFPLLEDVEPIEPAFTGEGA